MLDESLPEEGVSTESWYLNKFGEERVKEMSDYLKEIGDKCGINFAYFGGITANTIDSLRLIAYVLEEGGVESQDTVVETLFRAYFEEERNIADKSVLLEAAVQSGLQYADAAAFLATSKGREEVRQQINFWKSKYQMSGVPFFVFSDASETQVTTLNGAHESNEFVTIVKHLSG